MLTAGLTTPWPNCNFCGCYATVFVLSLQTCWMPRNCVCLVIAHMLDATQLCLSCHSERRDLMESDSFSIMVSPNEVSGCLLEPMMKEGIVYEATLKANNARRWWKNDVFFSADGSNTHEFQAKRLCEDTNPWKKWDEMNIWTNRP